MGSSPFLLSAAHGKARVRVAKVLRRGKVHELCELTVRVELLGGTDASFTHGDNANVVATDTCKNHVYVLAKTHSMSSVETFAMDLGSKFLELYHHINAVKVDIEERSWNRVQTGRMPHSHGFVLRGDGQRVCTAYVERDCVRLTSGLTGLSVLKTTQSGWANFVRDQYTTLPETNERILATTIDAKWAYGTSRPHELMKLDFGGIHRAIRHAFIIAFFGPPDKGVYSKGVQETLFKMGRSAIGARDEVDTVTLSLPNLHFLPCNIPVFQKNAIHFEDDVYIPNDEPHGIITATIGRAKDTGSDSDPTAFRSSLNRRARM